MEMEQKNLKVGAWGGNGGNSWDDGIFTGVREIQLEYNNYIDSILVVYDKQGEPFKAKRHGGFGGNNAASIKLKYPDEFLISVSGHGDSYIRSLTFKSNYRTFGPYGYEYGKRFTFSSYPVQEIVGFYGKSGSVLDSFGLHLSHASPRTLHQEEETGWAQQSLVVGPWGGNGGTNWDDGIFTGIRAITLVYCGCIDSISVVYDDHGLPFKTPKRGGRGGNKTAEIILQHPEEFLISVSGHYGRVNIPNMHDRYIRSLTFQTNLRTFGPYGIEEGTHFSFATYGRQVLGFKGRSGQFLDAIAFHLSGLV